MDNGRELIIALSTQIFVVHIVHEILTNVSES